ncbi:unnamed protein product [Ectocarpus sp. 12 AP-2014]
MLFRGPDVSKMKNLVMGFGKRRARRTSAATTRQLDMLERMKDYCLEEGVCRRYVHSPQETFLRFRSRQQFSRLFSSCLLRDGFEPSFLSREF